MLNVKELRTQVFIDGTRYNYFINIFSCRNRKDETVLTVFVGYISSHSSLQAATCCGALGHKLLNKYFYPSVSFVPESVSIDIRIHNCMEKFDVRLAQIVIKIHLHKPVTIIVKNISVKM